VQLDASQLAEYRQLKAQADDKAGRLLQEKSALEAQLKVRRMRSTCGQGSASSSCPDSCAALAVSHSSIFAHGAMLFRLFQPGVR
jgi:hypothetical protein